LRHEILSQHEKVIKFKKIWEHFYVIRKLSEMRFKASWIPLVVYNPLFANELSTINLLITNLTFNDLNNGNCAKFIHS